MLSCDKLKEFCDQQQVDIEGLAGQIARGGLDEKKAIAAIKNWQKGLLKPRPRAEDVRRLAAGLGVEVNDLADWRCSYRFAPLSARKARLVTLGVWLLLMAVSLLPALIGGLFAQQVSAP